MAIYRCNKCGHLREVTNDYTGKSVNCPSCKQSNPVHDTVGFIKKVFEIHLAQRKELRHLKQKITPSETEDLPTLEKMSLADIDIYNTTALASHQQYEPILTWFEKRQIQLVVNQQSLDTSGFFDEVAVQLGDNYEMLKLVSDKIKQIQQKGYTNVKLNLSKKSQKEVKEITQFCQTLYDYSFVAKYFYNNQDKIIRLTLQTAPAIVSFFNGIWMEWFVFMKLLELFREKQVPVACLRSLSVKFPNEDSHELDVFFLIDNIPLCIECKMGEYRQHIKKYSTLRKRLKLEKEQFLLCVIGLDQQQMQGLSSMYDLTFVNENTFQQHAEQLVVKEWMEWSGCIVQENGQEMNRPLLLVNVSSRDWGKKYGGRS